MQQKAQLPEPILEENADRLVLYPIEHDDIWKFYKKAEATINNDNKLWLYFGSGNTQKLQEQSSKFLNRVYVIKDKDFLLVHQFLY